MRKTTMMAAGAAALLLGVGVAVNANAFDLKPGLWEVTVNSESTGAPPIPDEMMARLTPEQRERVQAAMQQRMNHPSQRTYQKCLTREEIEDPFGMKHNKDQCTPKVLSKTSSSEKVQVECTGEIPSTIVYEWKAPTSKTMNGTMQMTAGAGSKVMKTNGQMSGKWLSADCGSVH